jgi:A49-like RNA polymerase I associated factor
VETFGSKRRQQAQRRADLHNIRKLEKDDIQSSAAIDSMLLQAAATAQERTDALSHNGQRKTLPPYNMRAKTVEEAYDLHRMLPASVWEGVPWKLFVNVAKRPSKLAQLRSSGRLVLSCSYRMTSFLSSQTLLTC